MARSVNNGTQPVLPEDSGVRFLKMMQASRDRVLLDKTFEVVEVAWGLNLRQWSFEEFVIIEKSADTFLRAWRNISIEDAIGVLAGLLKQQNNLQANTIPELYREYFSTLSVA